MSRVSETLRNKIVRQAGNRCGYCQARQEYVFGILEIEHIIPTARGGSDHEDNLWLACRLCNGYKSDQIAEIDPKTGELVLLFNPRVQHWSDHFAWSDDAARIIGLTPCGRATIIALKLNNPIAVAVRKAWVSAGWHPPT